MNHLLSYFSMVDLMLGFMALPFSTMLAVLLLCIASQKFVNSYEAKNVSFLAK